MLPCKTDLGPISRCSLYICIYIYTNLSSTYTNLYIYPTAQEPCTEIINSAVADVADMAHVTDGNPNKRCPVLCGLARIPHGVSEASQKTGIFIIIIDQTFFSPKMKEEYMCKNGPFKNYGSPESWVSNLKLSDLG